MEYIWQQASENEATHAFGLVKERIGWMDRVGIRQWNVGNYTQIFPESYYRDMARQAKLYLLRKGEKIVGAAVLLESDDRWDDNRSAYYIHNLVGSVQERGAGEEILRLVEKMAAQSGKEYVRLDCAADNRELNTYYEQKGYILSGECWEGTYHGNRRQKRVDK